MLLAVGQAVVIITRNVDLSVGSVLALTAYLTGRLFIDHPGIPIVAVFAACIWSRRAARPGQRRAGRVRQGAGAGHHARHALHLPRHHAHLGRQRPDQRLRHARRASSSSAPSRSSASRCSRSSPSSCWRRSATTSTPPAAGASSTRSAPTPTPPCSTACPYAAGCSAAFVLSGALAGLAGVLYAARYGTVSSGAGTGIELQAVAPRSSAASRSSAAAAPSGAPPSAPSCSSPSTGPCPILGIQDFWQRAVVGALILGAIVARPGARRPTGPQARRSEGQS